MRHAGLYFLAIPETALDNKSALSIITPGSYSQENNETSVHILIKTGRFHQIRRHLSMTGFPISGDSKYGNQQTTAEPLK